MPRLVIASGLEAARSRFAPVIAAVVSLLVGSVLAETFHVTVIKTLDGKNAELMCFVQKDTNKDIYCGPEDVACIQVSAKVETTCLISNDHFCKPFVNRMKQTSLLFLRLRDATDTEGLSLWDRWGELTTFRMSRTTCPIPDPLSTVYSELAYEQLSAAFPLTFKSIEVPALKEPVEAVDRPVEPPYVPPPPSAAIDND